MKVKPALAYPLAVGTEIPVVGRVKECADLVQSGSRLLDIGCSSGWLASLVMTKGFDRYVGVDRVIVGGEHEQSGANFVSGSVFNLPFRDKSFDAVCLFDVIEHLPRGSEKDALREAHRVLDSTGKLYFSTPHASVIHTPLDPVWLLGHRHYRRSTVRRLLQSADFSVDRLFVAGGVIEALDHVQLLVDKHLLHRKHIASNAVNQLVERSHRGDRRLGLSVFAIASR
jgi:SAM-dependent methyltransferase